MNKKLAFVLGGGGSRGALQVGALYGLLEHNLHPDLLVGTSIGAVNATFLALNGFSKNSLDLLTAAWQRAAELDLLPANYIRLTLRAMLGRSSVNPSQRLRGFFIDHGLAPELRFADVKQLRLIIVSADLNTGKPVLHGESSDDGILDALLVSTALPPWVMPVRKKGQFLMDGGVVSSLPIEPAMLAGATKIVALDLTDPRETFGANTQFGFFLDRLTFAVEQRHVDLELGLAKASGIPVFHINLTGKESIPLWDFHHADELIARGNEITQQAISQNEFIQFELDCLNARLPDEN
jgi:NTE family protein